VDKVRRISASPTMGQERIKDKHNYPRPQAEAEDNGHHRVHQRGIGYEETIGITYHCENTEKGVPGSNGTTPRESGRSHRIGRGIQDTDSIDPG
jgi:hypothetical protein